MKDEDQLRSEMIAEGTQWLLEMELLDNPQIKNFLVLNILATSKHIQDLDLIIDTHSKVMLVWIQISNWARFFKKGAEVIQTIEEALRQVLPSFRCRVVTDRAIFELGLKKAKAMAEGRMNEKNSNASDPVSTGQSNPSEGPVPVTGTGTSDADPEAAPRPFARFESSNRDGD